MQLEKNNSNFAFLNTVPKFGVVCSIFRTSSLYHICTCVFDSFLAFVSLVWKTGDN